MATQELVKTDGKPLIELRQEPGPSLMGLLQIALTNNAAIDVIERIAALREKEMLAAAELDFNEALNRVQSEIKRIAPDLENPNKKSKYASYAAIDRVIRPIYAKEGFALSFTHADCPKADHIRIICRVSLRRHKEPYLIDMPVDTKGPQGGDVMTKTHATAAADSYGKRYLVKDIFNIAIGDDDRDGNLDDTGERIEWINNCRDLQELERVYKDSAKAALAAGDSKAIRALGAAKDAKKKELART
jgi:hypothetical protein